MTIWILHLTMEGLSTPPERNSAVPPWTMEFALPPISAKLCQGTARRSDFFQALLSFGSLKKQQTMLLLPRPVRVELTAKASPAMLPPWQARPQQVWRRRPAQGSLQTAQGSLQTIAMPMLARSAKSREVLKPQGLVIPKGLANSWMQEPKPPGQVTTQAKSAANSPKPPSIKPHAHLISNAAEDPWMLLDMSEPGEATPVEVTEEPCRENAWRSGKRWSWSRSKSSTSRSQMAQRHCSSRPTLPNC